MKPRNNNDYSRMTEICKKLGMEQYCDYRTGAIQHGFYTLKGMYAPVDLTACAEDEISVLKTCLQQLSEKAHSANDDAMERAYNDF